MLVGVVVKEVLGDEIRLRPWTGADAEWYVAARDEEVFRFTTERRDLTGAEVTAAIERARDDPTTAAFAITDRDGTLVGNLAITMNGTFADLSYFLAPAGRGRGLATDAVRAAVGWLADRGTTEV